MRVGGWWRRWELLMGRVTRIPKGEGIKGVRTNRGERRTDWVSLLPRGEGIKGVRTNRGERRTDWVSLLPRGEGIKGVRTNRGERRTDWVSLLPRGEGIKGVRTYRRGNTWVSTRRVLYVSTNRRWIASVGNASSAP